MAEKRKLKDSVFTKVFGEPEYAFQLYKVFHPEDTTSTEKDIKIITIDNAFVNGEFNDLGLLMNDRLMLFVEAQSTWCDCMAIRILFYLVETYRRYLHERDIDILRATNVKIPIPEAYVIFTGNRSEKPEMIRLSDHFPKDNLNFVSGKNSLELNVKMIYNSSDGDIVCQYITFCRVFDTQRKLYSDDYNKAISETIRICKDKNVLSDYIRKHESEVYEAMAENLSDFFIELHIRSEKKIAREQGLAEGRAEGLEKGAREAKLETARNLLAEGLSPEIIAKCTNLPLAEITALQAEPAPTVR